MECGNTENNSESLKYLNWNVVKYYSAYVINTHNKKTSTTVKRVMCIVGIWHVVFPIL